MREPCRLAVLGAGHVGAGHRTAGHQGWIPGGHCHVGRPGRHRAESGVRPRWREIIALIAPERGFAIPTEESFEWETGPHGALYVGSPETVAQKIATNLRALGATRFDLKYGMPGLTHDQLMTNIELYGRRVIPRVRELLS